MKQLLTPRWITAHIGVLIIAIVFVSLGFWQLQRLSDRRIENAVAQSRYEAPPQELELLLRGAGQDFESLRYRRAVVTGTYDPELEVLTRNQVYQSQAGFHVVDPLVMGSGGAVLVNRGWVPLTLDTPPIEEASPPARDVEVVGWIAPSQQRPALGRTDPEDEDLDVLSRIDIGRIQEQVPYELTPVYLILEDEISNELPIPLATPEFGDEGNHLPYAIQWFGFTVIALVGYFFLIRKSLSKSGT